MQKGLINIPAPTQKTNHMKATIVLALALILLAGTAFAAEIAAENSSASIGAGNSGQAGEGSGVEAAKGEFDPLIVALGIFVAVLIAIIYLVIRGR
ncbi:Uncharacterised protein [Candidatus Gugararchaeum adminiculabundum]|nr:Uncharacterised protein [Candidatus Gugararchaeum adminiculabundum]